VTRWGLRELQHSNHVPTFEEFLKAKLGPLLTFNHSNIQPERLARLSSPESIVIIVANESEVFNLTPSQFHMYTFRILGIVS
jgi:hypothetical protein